MAITFSTKANATPAGMQPTEPIRRRSIRLSLAATDVYAPGGLNIAAALEAAYPGEEFQLDGFILNPDGGTVRMFEVKHDAVAGLAFTGEDGTDGTETWNLTDGDTIDVIVDGGSPQTVTFNTGDFVDIDAATAAEIVIVINADTTGCTASADANGRVVIKSDTTGASSSIVITDVTGTATALHFSEDVATGYHTGTAAGTRRLYCVELATTLGEAPAGTDLSGHTLDLPAISV